MDVTYKDLLAMIGERELTIKAQQQEIAALQAAVEQLQAPKGKASMPKDAKRLGEAS